MKMCKLLSILFFVSVSAGICWSGGVQESAYDEPATETASKERTITVVDSIGNEKEVILPVERIVIFSGEGTLSAIRTMKAEEKVVGVVDMVIGLTTRFPNLSDAVSIGSMESPDFETILSLEPDIVLAPYWATPELEKQLEPGVVVLRLDVGPPLTYAEDMMKLAKVLEKTDEAQEFIDWYRGKIDNITNSLQDLPENERPVVFDYYGGDWGLTAGPPYGTYGKDNVWVGPMIKMTGGTNLSREMPGDWIIVDPEYVVMENPEIIIREVFSAVSGEDVVGFDAESTTGIETIYTSLLEDSGFESIEAVKNKRVYLCDGQLIQSDWFIGLQYMAKWFHPEIFTKLEPQAIHQEYLKRFQRIDFDVEKQGVFIYPLR